MDKNAISILSAELESQMIFIRNITTKITERSVNLQPDDYILMESIAYQIHNLYNATEDLLKIVAGYFENNIKESDQWHKLLLQRMSIDIPGIRPAFISSETHLLLNGLRGFRHFFRHSYGTFIEYDQLKANLDKALNLSVYLEVDINQFFSHFL